MNWSGSTVLAAGAFLSLFGSPALAQEPSHGAELVSQALVEARQASPDIELTSFGCTTNQRMIAWIEGDRLYYPCMVNELVHDRFDAAMLVNLLLAEPVAEAVERPKGDPSLAESAAAIGAAAIGAGLDDDTDAKRVDRYYSETPSEPNPPLARFYPRDSDTFRAEVSRVDNLRDNARRSDATDERMQERLEERRREEREVQARYQSVTDFLNLSRAQDFCPADGRTFLARAVEFSTSPRPDDRMVGLWADDRRQVLQAYLNDVSLCR